MCIWLALAIKLERQNQWLVGFASQPLLDLFRPFSMHLKFGQQLVQVKEWALTLLQTCIEVSGRRVPSEGSTKGILPPFS